MRWSPLLLLKAHSVLMSFQTNSSHFGKTSSNQFFPYGTITSFLQINSCVFIEVQTHWHLHFFTFSHLQKIKHSNKKIFNIPSRISSMSLIRLITIDCMSYFNLIFLYISCPFIILWWAYPGLDDDDISVSAWDCCFSLFCKWKFSFCFSSVTRHPRFDPVPVLSVFWMEIPCVNT